jgi:uncharacterized repeat protein (TIGR01451 family)
MFTRFLLARYWFFWLLACPALLSAQGWQRLYGSAGDDRAFALRLTPDGGLVVAGSTVGDSTGQTDWYFLKTDSVGNLLAEQRWGDADYYETPSALLPSAGGTWLVSGSKYRYQFSFGDFETYGVAARLGADGALQAEISYAATTAFNAATAWGDDYLLAGGQYFLFGTDSDAPRFFYQKIDAAGNLLWQRLADLGDVSEAKSALALPDGNVCVAGHFLVENQFDLAATKVNPQGDEVQNWELDLPGSQQTAELLLSTNGNLLLVATNDPFSPSSAHILLIGLSPNLDTLWTRALELGGGQIARAALVLPNGDIAIAGEHIAEGALSRDAFLLLTDSLGHLRWFKTYGGSGGDIFWDLQAAPDGNGFVVAGQTASFSLTGDLQAWLLRTDSLGVVWSNRVLGRVVRDATQNCTVDAGEPPLADWFVAASGSLGTFYTRTDSLGSYAVELDTGAWFVSVLPPSGYWGPCEDSVAVDLVQVGESQMLDFPTQAVYDCPLLDVDLTTPFLRRCFPNDYHVRYFNYGTAAAPNTLIFIVLDPFLSPLQSDIPYTQSGDTLFFSVGEVGALAGGNFRFSALLACDGTVLGQTHCAEAHISPDSLCYAFNPEWDGAHLEVDGYCAGDSVLLTVTNTGLSMQTTVDYIITEDQIIFRLSTLQLAAGQDTTFVLHPNGSTVALLVEQTLGHPGSSQPVLVIEGCGGWPFSTGYALQFPQNDGDLSTDIECRQSIGSFDPNDKTGLPTGVGAQHVIAPGTDIEYLIRFQNTGSDTAFRVEIRDTLPAALDVATFREGASSHDYQLKISELGVFQFIFDPIALPDSGANAAASQGFVKFRISPKKDRALGTRIENRAAIYFDFNAPVVTNATLHTVDDPLQFLTSSLAEPIGTNTAPGVPTVAPNPTSGSVLVNLTQPLESGGLRLEVRDALGRCWPADCRREGAGWRLDVGGLPSGIYFLSLVNQWDRNIRTVKLIKK